MASIQVEPGVYFTRSTLEREVRKTDAAISKQPDETLSVWRAQCVRALQMVTPETTAEAREADRRNGF
jgi:copper oxidase (laccase) domain-containing protein